MIFQYGNIAKLRGQFWRMLELSNEKTIEQTMRRIGKAIPSIFRSEPVEIFVPVFARDLDVFEMKTGIYIFIRTAALQPLLRLKTVTGVISLVTEGDINHPSKAILVQDAYVQDVIKDVEKEFWARSKDLKVGDFVRIIDGETRDYCGIIEVLQGELSCIRVNLKTKSMLIETPTKNLLNLSHIPKHMQVFYFCPAVDSMFKTDALTLEEAKA
jgi:transcription antitermination factor NusG